MGVLLPVFLLLAMCAAFYAMAQWRAERNRLCETPEGVQLEWPHLRHRKQVTVLGQMLPFAVSIGFLLAWTAILIQMATG